MYCIFFDRGYDGGYIFIGCDTDLQALTAKGDIAAQDERKKRPHLAFSVVITESPLGTVGEEHVKVVSRRQIE